MLRLWRNLALSFVALSGLSFAVPASAQMYSPGFQFLKAVKDGDSDKVVELIEKNSTTIVNSQDLTSGESGMHILVRQRQLIWLRYLLQQGGNPNIADKKGVTPLVLASQLGWLEGVEELIKRKAKVDVANSTGETPLIAAVHRSDTTMMRMLLKGGADPDRADSSGRTARDYAALGGSQLVNEITRSEQPKSQREGAKSYGPSF